mmetsp:Transcript_29510/g.59329  ORF Transcript_29510/g.59329 Transcript_29510/m.59329 type:complete len:265 (+) Transcript_29510:35-829(+)|eukprot:scaffold426_cov98-Skeletonema_marinoi.AAC.2
MSSEKTPLLSTPSKGKDDAPPAPPVIASPTAYFLDGAHRRKPSSFSFYYSKDSVPPPSSRDKEEVDNFPSGASSSSEFNSRPVSGKNNTSNDDGFKRLTQGMRAPSVGGDWLSYVARSKDAPSAPRGDDFAAESGEVGTLLIPRKVPIKVEPKVHFANERTFLAWLHVVVMLAGASVTIVTFAEGQGLVEQLFGVILLPVSIAYIFYALSQYVRRAMMIKHHEPGPYIDVVGPTVLTTILVLTITVQFFGKLHSVMKEEPINYN